MGPVIAHKITIEVAPINATELPVNAVIQLANFSKNDLFEVDIWSIFGEGKIFIGKEDFSLVFYKNFKIASLLLVKSRLGNFQ